jgi:hypothetical protein
MAARSRRARELLDAFARPAAFGIFHGRAEPPAARFPHVRVSGRFVEGRGYLRDEQVRDGKVGVEVIDAFAVDGSAALLLVDRGWIAWTRSADAKPVLPPLPEGEVSLAGVYAPFPGSGMRVGGNVLAAQKAWPKLTLALDPAEISGDLGRPLLPRVLLLDPDAASGFVRTLDAAAVMPPARHQATRSSGSRLRWRHCSILCGGLGSWKKAKTQHREQDKPQPAVPDRHRARVRRAARRALLLNLSGWRPATTRNYGVLVEPPSTSAPRR